MVTPGRTRRISPPSRSSTCAAIPSPATSSSRRCRGSRAASCRQPPALVRAARHRAVQRDDARDAGDALPLGDAGAAGQRQAGHARLGAEPHTPIDEALRATLAGLNVLPRPSARADRCLRQEIAPDTAEMRRRSTRRAWGRGPTCRPCPARPSTTRSGTATWWLTRTARSIFYIDLHLIHEVTTPQAFAGLRAAKRGVRRPDRTLAVADHNVPTEGQALGVAAVADEEARLQLQTLERNVKDYGIEFFPMGDIRNGIVHVVGPEQGRTQPGMTIVCGDSHTSTHGAFGALAHGIGTSEVEHVLATQTLRQKKSKNLRVTIDGRADPGRRRQGLCAGGDRRDRHRRRHRLCHRIRRLGDPGAVDGRAHDALQPDHRGRRAGGPGRAGRDHLRLSARPPGDAQGRGLGDGAAATGRASSPTPDAHFDREITHRRRRQIAPAGHLGHQPRGRGRGHRPGARRRRASPAPTSAPRPSGRWSTWA